MTHASPRILNSPKKCLWTCSITAALNRSSSQNIITNIWLESQLTNFINLINPQILSVALCCLRRSVLQLIHSFLLCYLLVSYAMLRYSISFFLFRSNRLFLASRVNTLTVPFGIFDFSTKAHTDSEVKCRKYCAA